MHPHEASGDGDGVRIDVWLWAARFFKTRALAKQAVLTGKVEVDGQRAKPSRQLRIGDALVLLRGEERLEVTVRGLSEARGPAKLAQALYEESEASRQRREAEGDEAGQACTAPDPRAGRYRRQLSGGGDSRHATGCRPCRRPGRDASPAQGAVG
jgi:ribosome-associated heat shock protein Hsp15